MLSQKIQEFIKEKLAVVSDDGINAYSLIEGRSGADVYRIKIKSRRDRLNGSYIVKVCSIPERDKENEANKANILHHGATDFSQHLVKVEKEAEVDGKYLIIYHQANDIVIDMTAFSELSGEVLAKYVKQVSFDLLARLNNDKKTDGTASDFFNCLLAKQLGENGRFESRIRNLIDNPETESIALIGKVFPNPYYLIKNISKLEQCLLDQIFLKGMVHGDLHGYNMIASSDTYSLIDYDSVMEDAYLFFDQAYFEFSVFYDNSKDNDLKRWNSLLDVLIKPSIWNDADICEYYKEYIVRNAVCNGIVNWIENEHLEKMKDDIELQFMMARIAAGINFFCKKNCMERGKQLKVLFYIAYCCKLLAEKTGYQYDENDISALRVPPEYTNTEELWEGFVKFTNYVPILITDDKYSGENCGEPENICAMNWKLVIDIGLEQENFGIYKYFLKKCKTRVARIDATLNEKAESFGNTLNVLAIRKSADKSYRSLWRDYKNAVTDALKKLLSENPHVPLVFVFDCSISAAAFKDKLINDLCDLKLPGATRIVSLRTRFSKDMKEEIPELEDKHKWRFVEHEGANLIHVGLTCKMYLNQPDNVTERSANLPSINGIYKFNNKDLCSFEDSIELVYSGCERSSGNDMNCSGLDMSGGGESFGEAFYKGNEATWNDIANNRDLMLVDDTKHTEICDKLSKLLNDTSPRVKTTALLHGAGSGGTTLSKHILWYFKDQFPCARLKKYTSRTAEILTEIYRNTGKCILLSVESGSTVISDEELNKLKKAVDAENGRMVVLLIKRIGNNSDRNEEKHTTLAFLGNTMPIPIAKDFYNVFSAIASKKEDGNERRKLLEKITGVDRYKEQRSPFFYGFYTFQEEYQLMESLSKTVSECSSKERILLNSLSLITVFSQNICVAFSELKSLLDRPNTGDTENIYALLESLSPAIFKLMTIRDKEGLRLCHKVIAEKILFLLHTPEIENPKIKDVTFKSAKMYIETLGEFYDDDSEYVDKILKELIIDHAYIDSEERKTKFSLLVESIHLWTEKKDLFDLLIEKFPNNPHYYNHLARLLAIGDKSAPDEIVPQYEKAVETAEKAIKMAVSDREMHETTLGCIYGQWIINTIDSEKEYKKSRRLHSKYPELISEISVRYGLAKDQFDNAREDTDVYDSFSFFPQINMECEIISHLISFDEDRDILQLINEEPYFSEWYNDHFSVAMELYIRMREQLGDDVRLLKEAKNKLKNIAQRYDEVDEHFTELLASDSPANRRYRRSLAYTVFSRSGCSWEKVAEHTLQLMEQCFRKNVMTNDTDHNNSDIGTWFELYRRVTGFQAFKAQSFIADYMDDGYRKEYLLFLMNFIMRKEGISSASTEVINRHIAEANRIARLNGLNTAKEHDAYVGGKNGKCPIVPLSGVNRDKAEEPAGLEEFTGIVTQVEQTHGKILLNGLNLEVTFVPRPQSAGEDSLRMFTRDDVDCPVKLNIMFSYSGLRGWNVIKTRAM